MVGRHPELKESFYVSIASRKDLPPVIIRSQGSYRRVTQINAYDTVRNSPLLARRISIDSTQASGGLLTDHIINETLDINQLGKDAFDFLFSHGVLDQHFNAWQKENSQSNSNESVSRLSRVSAASY